MTKPHSVANIKSAATVQERIGTLLREAAKAEPRTRREIVANLAEVAGSDATGESFARILFLLDDDDAIVRRRVIEEIGKSQWSMALSSLKKSWDKDRDPTNKKSLMTALSKHGDGDVANLIAAYDAPDPVSQKVKDKALLLLKRTTTRPGATVKASEQYDWSVSPGDQVTLSLHCRSGTESYLSAALTKRKITPKTSPGLCRVTLHDPLKSLFDIRLFVDFGLSLFCEVKTLEEAAELACKNKGWTQALQKFTRGPVRFRLDISDEGVGKQNAKRFALIQIFASLQPEWINDTRETAWDISLKAAAGGFVVEAQPKQWADPRFTYCRSAVAGASHPTLAALLASLTETQAGDLVWDPFAGGAVELIEVAKQEPKAKLYGTDINETALASARENIAAAGMGGNITLSRTDAATWKPPGKVSVVVTNPPMGKRVPVKDLGGLIERVLMNAHSHLGKNGKIILFSPLPKVSSALLLRLGMKQDISQTVDLGGFHVELQRFVKV